MSGEPWILWVLPASGLKPGQLRQQNATERPEDQADFRIDSRKDHKPAIQGVA